MQLSRLIFRVFGILFFCFLASFFLVSIKALGAEPPCEVVVRSGDTIAKLALSLQVTPQELTSWNSITNPDMIEVGDVLRCEAPLPTATNHATTNALASTTWLWVVAYVLATPFAIFLAAVAPKLQALCQRSGFWWHQYVHKGLTLYKLEGGCMTTKGIGPRPLGMYQWVSEKGVPSLEMLQANNLLNILNVKVKVRPWFGRLMALSITLMLCFMSKPLIPILLCTVGLIGGYYHYAQRRQVVIMYDLEGGQSSHYAQMAIAFQEIRACSKLWYVPPQTRLGAANRHLASSGESVSFEFREIKVGYGAPPHIRTNVNVPSLQAGHRILYFMPDQILVYQPFAQCYEAVPYTTMQFDSGSTLGSTMTSPSFPWGPPVKGNAG